MNHIILIAILGIISLFVGVFNGRKLLLPIITIGLMAELGLCIMDWNMLPEWYGQFSSMILFDKYAIAFTGIISFSTLFLFWIGDAYYHNQDQNKGDIYGLMLFTLSGAVIMCSYNHLAMLFLGIEILSISLYILAGSKKFDLASNEASLKYFIMGSFSTGFLLFGIALMYGATNTFNLDLIRDYIAMQSELPVLFKVGLILVMCALTFKVSAVPFHFWAPDVYQGSPSVVTAFMSTIVKTAGFAAMFRLFNLMFGGNPPEFAIQSLLIIAALTICVGNFTALAQVRVKRILAYSSISNAGYILLGVTAFNVYSSSSILIYTLAYSIGTILAFSVLMSVVENNGNDDFSAFHGVAKKNPLLAVAISIALLSLAGIPPLAGFMGKYSVFKSALYSNHIWIVFIAVINSLVGVYYYFKIMIAMFQNPENGTEIGKFNLPMYSKVAIVFGILFLLALGLFPDSILGLLSTDGGLVKGV